MVDAKQYLSSTPTSQSYSQISIMPLNVLQDGTRQTVNDLLTKYPSLTSKVTLGYPTAELRQRLYALVITNKRTNRYKGKMLVISSIHAREIATSELGESH